MSCPSCLSPRLEGRDRAGGQGWGGHRARHCCSHRSPLSFLLEPPELQHHVIWDLPGRGGGGGLLLPPCLMPTPCPAPHGRGLKAKEKYPFGFFLLCFFFLREVIFYSGFILKEKEKPKKKKKSIYLHPPSLSPASRKLHICLKTEEGFLQEPRERVAFTEPSFCFSAPLLPPPRGPLEHGA